MRRWGTTFLVLGIGSFVLPLMGLQFALLNLFGEARPYAAGAMIVAGAVMLVQSSRAQKAAPLR